MKIVVRVLSGACLLLLVSSGIYLWWQPPVVSNEWAWKELDIESSDELEHELTPLPIKVLRRFGHPGNNPTVKSATVFDPEILFHELLTPTENIRFLRSEDAKHLLADSDLVLGINSGDFSRAYPVSMFVGPGCILINDTFDGRKIAATW